MPDAHLQFNFLTEYVQRLLELNGLGNLTPEQQARFVPQLVRQVQERLGMEMVPRLTDEQAEEFVNIANNPATTVNDWKNFWEGAFPDFQTQVEHILTEFAAETRDILSAV